MADGHLWILIATRDNAPESMRDKKSHERKWLKQMTRRRCLIMTGFQRSNHKKIHLVSTGRSFISSSHVVAACVHWAVLPSTAHLAHARHHHFRMVEIFLRIPCAAMHCPSSNVAQQHRVIHVRHSTTHRNSMRASFGPCGLDRPKRRKYFCYLATRFLKF